MKHIVWVAGPSVSGKRTFIECAARNPMILASLGIKAESVMVSSLSLEYVGHMLLDTRVLKRRHIVYDVQEKSRTADVVLIKWQFVDSICRRPQKLARLMPGAGHWLIELQLPASELTQRLTQRSWRHLRGKEAIYLNVERYFVCLLTKHLVKNIKHLVVNSGQGKRYQRIS